jgi:hypothetical protein
MKNLIFIILIFILISFVFADKEEMTKKAEVTVTWTTKTISVCPPGILGTEPCNYPTIQNLASTTIDFLLAVSPSVLVILLILGGLMYLLVPFGVEEFIKKGHNYIKFAVLGYVILLLTSLIFTVIGAILGGP